MEVLSTLSSEQLDNTEIPYKSAFTGWDNVASVRAKPVRYLQEEDIEGKYFFTPELVPVTGHPLVQERGEKTVKQIIIYHLYTHLEFTENLEHEVVNYVAYKIGRKKLGIDLPFGMIEDAWKLYVDEAYHFKFSADLAQQVQQKTGVQLPRFSAPNFLYQLHKLLDEVPHSKHDLIYTFFSIISETLITGTLSTVPQDERVVPAVREVIGDHAEDEKRHHVYFAKLLGIVWERLSPENQRLVGPLLPTFIFSFCEPDFGAIRAWLRELRFSEKEMDRILEESFPSRMILDGVRNGCKITLRHLRNAGVFEEKYTEEEFHKRGLLQER